jgi:hypothetical protein
MPIDTQSAGVALESGLAWEWPRLRHQTTASGALSIAAHNRFCRTF